MERRIRRALCLLMVILLIGGNVRVALATESETSSSSDSDTSSGKTAGDLVVEALEMIQKQFDEDKKAGIKWEYHNKKKFTEEWWEDVISKNKRNSNCALLARWALREAGVLGKGEGGFWGEYDTTIHWMGKGEKYVKERCEVINIGGKKTVKQMMKNKEFEPGDVVTYYSMGHTNIYGGDNMWYDAGHGNCTSMLPEGAVFRTFYGPTTCSSATVSYVIRPKKAPYAKNPLDDSSSSSDGNSSTGKLELLVPEKDLKGMPKEALLNEKQGSVELPSADDMSAVENSTVSTIKSSIIDSKRDRFINYCLIGVVFLGLVMLIYSILILVTYAFDRSDLFFGVSLLGIITMGKLSQPEEGYIPFGKILGIVAVFWLVGGFLVSTGAFSVVTRLLIWVTGILKGI